ncbi:BTB/POZ protein [Rhizophagus clarus]|uniref:BTB/POZ protein n=1 Tax=Rhizophagus clarus TaxID=94130 RepID=A0A8H3LYN1_9GLOM|nr:BTB/POZ protein [Rhizophagus clarus]
MSTQFLSKLSQNYIELLDDNEYYDVTIEVGKDPNVRILRSHKNILCHRSPYLRRTLASSKNRNVLVNIKLPNISPEVFQIILRYIYGGILSLNVQDPSEIFQTLLAAEELLLQELIDYLQKYLIENKSEWMEQHFEFIHRTSFQFNSLVELQQFCTDFMVKSPEKIFKSLDFTSISEKSLVQFIKRDDLQMKEIDVWEHVLRWGRAQNTIDKPDPNTWSDDDFERFLQKVRPYKKLLNSQLYENLLNSHLDPDSEPTDNILPPRNIRFDNIIDSKIVNLKIISVISRWIDKVDVNCVENAIISNLEKTDCAFYCSPQNGPDFGDIIVWAPEVTSNYTSMVCRKRHHEKRIRDVEGNFIIEDYEVFQIIKR